MVRLVVCVVLAMCSIALKGQIFIDEDFSDWSASYLKADAPGNNLSGNIDIQKLWLTDDDNYLYIRLDLDQEIKLQETNKLGIQLDIDNNVNTGFKTNGIGAEISIYFGDRDIFLNVGNTNQIITHEKIGLVALPSVSSAKFELRLKKQNTINGVNVNMANTIAVVAVDRIANGDKIPSSNTGLKYQMSNAFSSGTKNYSFNKLQSNHLRVMSYNIELDGLFDAVRGPIQQKLIKAANPDVVCLQEVYDHSVQEVIAVMNSTIPLPNNKSWQGFKTNPDQITLTRYKAEAFESLNGNNISLLTVEASGSKPLVIFNNHLPCCEKDDERQNEIDAMLKRHRDMKANGGNTFGYAKNTATIILGDMNMVGLRQQQQSLLTGDIFNEASYGLDYKMDWDNTDMEDAKPFVPNTPNAYTWFSLGNGYVPGRLDYMLYTGSVMTLKNSFVLETSTIDASTLQANNLESEDSHIAADHLPLISDFFMGKEALTASIKVKQAIKCFGETETVVLSVSNGTKPYTYALGNGIYQTDSTFNNLIAGNSYAFYVKDASGTLVAFPLYKVIGVDELSVIINTEDDLVTLNISGGTGPYSYAFPGGIFSPYTGPFNVTENKQYTVTIKDGNGCLKNVDFTINIDKDNDGYNTDVDCNDANAAVNPSATEIIGNGIDDDCKNGELTLLNAIVNIDATIPCFGEKAKITIVANGGQRPYQYSIDGIAFSNDSTYEVFAGLYSPKVKDTSGQVFDTGIKTITQPNEIKADVTIANLIATFAVSGGVEPYYISINGGDFSPLSDIQLEYNKPYEIEIKDKNDCTKKLTLQPITNAVNEVIESKFKIYPNPTTYIVNIEGDEKVKNIILYNSIGNKVKQTNLRSFDISELPDGIYILAILNTNDKIEYHSLVKE